MHSSTPAHPHTYTHAHTRAHTRSHAYLACTPREKVFLILFLLELLEVLGCPCQRTQRACVLHGSSWHPPPSLPLLNKPTRCFSRGGGGCKDGAEELKPQMFLCTLCKISSSTYTHAHIQAEAEHRQVRVYVCAVCVWGYAHTKRIFNKLFTCLFCSTFKTACPGESPQFSVLRFRVQSSNRAYRFCNFQLW